MVKPKLITSYLKRKTTLEEAIASLAAEDGLSFNQIAKSKMIRRGLESLGYDKIPTSPNGVSAKISSFSQSVIKQYKEEICEARKSSKFSVVFDEWSSVRIRRYVNITVLCGNKFWNLGLARIIGSATSENCLNVVESTLKTFGIEFKNDIVCIITDGCNVMKRIGNLIKPVNQQLCFAHAIQLAITDVLYSKEEETTQASVEQDVVDEQDELQAEELISSIFEPMNLNPKYKQLIQKVRSLVSKFRKSPLKNEILQKQCFIEFGKELQLINDCRTRWNSLCSMLERFYQLRNCVQKAMIDLTMQSDFTEKDFCDIKELVEALKPVRSTVEAICRRDANLITADVAFDCLIKHLANQKTPISLQFQDKLVSHLEERRTDLSDVLKFLHTGNAKSSIHHSLSILPANKTRITKLIIDILKQLSDNQFAKEDELGAFLEETDDDSMSFDQSPAKRQRLDEDFTVALNKAIDKSKEKNESEELLTEGGLSAAVKMEIQLFETNGFKLGSLNLLQSAYSSLLTVSPTSVESERAFSSAGYLCNKFRSRLSDEMLNTICFLRAYFQCNNAKNQM